MREGCGVFDVSHMGEIETAGPGALDLLQRLLSNDVAKLEVGGAQYSVLCREDGGVLDDLFTYRLADDRYLTVTNAANHERDLAWFQRARRRASTPRSPTASTTTRCSPSRARRRASIVAPARRRRAAAADAHGRLAPTPHARRRSRGRGGSCSARLRHRATRARTGSRSWSRPIALASSGTRCSRPAPRRPGSAPATRCGSRSASTSTATTCPRTATRSRPGSAGAARRRRASSAPRPSPRRARTGPPEKLVAVRAHRARHPAPGQRRSCAGDERRGRGHERHPVAVAGAGRRHGATCAPTSPSRAPRSRSTSGASAGPRA